MEDKLKKVVDRIENSQLSEEEKNELYALVADGLQRIVWPVMVKYMPEKDLEYLAEDPKTRVTVESYAKLIGETIANGEALGEMEEKLTEALVGVERALTSEGV